MGFFVNTTPSSSLAWSSEPKLRSFTFLNFTLDEYWYSSLRKMAHFLAPFLRCSSSFSLCPCSLARCCSRLSAAVIRGTISSNGLSTIRIDLIFGGLWKKFFRGSRKIRRFWKLTIAAFPLCPTLDGGFSLRVSINPRRPYPIHQSS